jgi:hypothetical protein
MAIIIRNKPVTQPLPPLRNLPMDPLNKNASTTHIEGIVKAKGWGVLTSPPEDSFYGEAVVSILDEDQKTEMFPIDGNYTVGPVKK